MQEIKKTLNPKLQRENPKEFWNQKSEIFFKMLKGKMENESKIILEILNKKNLIDDKLTVLDLGCGFGRHIKFFQTIAKECVGLDISEKMLEIAREYVEPKESTNFYCVDWSNSHFYLENRNKFSLVFSSMSEALSSEEDLKKFIDCSSNYCMIERFLREDNPLSEFLPDIDNDRPNDDWEYSRDLINLLWNLGYYPESIVYSFEKEFSLTDEDIEYRKLKEANVLTNEIEEAIKNNGGYKYTKHIVKILIFWNVNERRV